jgi:predicted CoA-binding protein
MPSAYEEFWNRSSFAVVGHSAKKSFPRLTYAALKKTGRTVFAVDPSVGEIEGDKTYPDLKALPQPVEAVVLEPPKEETADWVKRAADAGIKNVWIHMNRDTPEAVAVAEREGLNLMTGTCAVMYVTPGLTYHSVHKWINKLVSKY